MPTSLTRLYVHLVWGTWDREPIIREEIKARLYAAMAKRCKELGCHAIAIGGVEDHVHLLVFMHPSVAVSDLVKDIKGASSHLINHEIHVGSNFRWQGAYAAYTLRENEVDQLTRYILHQPQHHSNHTLDLDHEFVDQPSSTPRRRGFGNQPPVSTGRE